MVTGAVLSTGLGSDFAVGLGRLPAVVDAAARVAGGLGVDLIAVHRLIEDAKANVVEFKPGLDLNAHNAESNRRLGPG